MSLILCPECGSKISDKATHCPCCGFQSADSTRPISEQNKYEIFPTFKYEIPELSLAYVGMISYEDNKNFIAQFGNWEKIKVELPAIAEIIISMAQKEHIMVAKMDSYVKKLIEEGIYKFSVDKNGDILPTIRDGKNIVKQVRLENMTLTPNLIQSLNNLSLHATMAQILNEIKFVSDSIKEIHIELQNDRLAVADSARDKLKQAMKIQDSKLRTEALLNAINSATDAKNTLMRNFSQNLYYIQTHANQNAFQKFKKNDSSDKAVDALQALVIITNAVQIECEGYAVLGEFETCKECLEEFRKFIVDNRLDERDTLLLLNENSPVKKIYVVNQFQDISKRITNFDASFKIEVNNKTGDEDNE